MVSSKSSAMPERSRIRPIKVKKGMASKVSLLIMPNSLLGSACKSSGLSNPNSIPIKPNSSPFAAREKATGKPDSRKTTSVMNITGAMFAIRNSVMIRLPSRRLVCRCWSPLPSSAGSLRRLLQFLPEVRFGVSRTRWRRPAPSRNRCA